jgi:hypothetical protein
VATIGRMDRLRAGALAALVLLVLIAAAGCGSPTGTVPGARTAGASSPVPVTPTIDVEQPGQTPSAGQVDTEWGPIWETLPEGFPVPPGAQPAEADTTASAAYTVPAGAIPDARQVASFYGRAFSAAGYGGSVDGPFEDGSYTAWASNGYGCDILVSTLPRGPAETYVTVLYGALCPFSWSG